MTWLNILYGIGMCGTFIYNLYDMVYVQSWWRIFRNAIFWPVFLPILIALR